MTAPVLTLARRNDMRDEPVAGSAQGKKPSKTAAELEASIKVEMEDICDWPTNLAETVGR